MLLAMARLPVHYSGPSGYFSGQNVRRAYHALSVSATCHLDEGYYNPKSWQGMYCFYLPLFTHLKLLLPFLPTPPINNHMHLVVNEQNVFINF